MADIQNPTVVTVVPTNTQIVPLKSGNQLDPPFDESAILYDGARLVYSCSIMVPVEVSLSEVEFQQFYESGASVINIYCVYTYKGHLSGNFTQYNVQMTALDTENDEPISMDSIELVYSLIVNEDPKTSRGTVTTVRNANTQG
jgi:hypothetical protein